MVNDAGPGSGRSRLRPILEGAGFATIYILPFADAFLTPSLGASYHHLYPVTTIARAILFTVLLLWGLAAVAFATLERLPQRIANALWIVPMALGLWLACSVTRGLLHWPHLMRFAQAAQPYAILTGVLLGALLLWAAPKLFRRSTSVLRLVYAASAFGLVVMLPPLVRFSVRTMVPEIDHFEHANVPAMAPGEPRIIWVLMDELSYQQAFEHPAPGMVLPHLKAFAQQSVVYSDVKPAGIATENVLPALMLGEPVAEVQAPYQGKVEYRSVPGGAWHPFDENRSIFGDAHAMGWSTGVVGWFNPYCRLLPHALDTCFWQEAERDPTEFGRYLTGTRSTAKNMLALLPVPATSGTPRDANLVEQHQQSYSTVMDAAREAILAQRIRFLFIHLPSPHPPGIYDRRRHVLASSGNYLDNLALADEGMGELMNAVRATSAAGNTTVLLTSDHSWRVMTWRKQPAWTAEEERVTGGRFDPRPVLMVHLPADHQQQSVTQPVDALLLHQVLEALLRGQVHTPEELVTWSSHEDSRSVVAGQ